MKFDLPKHIHALVEQHGTPLMVLDRSPRAGVQQLPQTAARVRLYYAVKANPHPDIIKTFRDLGGCFDVASEGEMRNVLAQEVSPDRLILANTVKRPKREYAKNVGVNLVTFDSEPELYKIAKYAPGCRVLPRLKVSNLGSMVELSLKFGADQDQIVPMLRKAAARSATRTGQLPRRSQCTDFDTYHRAFEVAASIVEEARKQGLAIKVLDIGGGFPIRHFRNDTSPSRPSLARWRKEWIVCFRMRSTSLPSPAADWSGPLEC